MQTKKQSYANRSILATLGFLIVLGLLSFRPAQAADVRDIVFPVLWGATYRNDYGDPRPGGRTHEGNDLFAPKHTPLLAVTDGVVHVAWPQPTYGYFISLHGDDGYDYWYIHINNDRLGTDDGLGGGRHAYQYNVDSGYRVQRGQVIGFLGDSGNAENTPAHLHFEIHRPDDNVINPYLSLRAATVLYQPTPTPTLSNEIWPYAQFRGGAKVALGDVAEDVAGEELVTGAGPGGTAHVRIFDSQRQPLTGFYAYDPSFRGGLDVAIGDINGDGDREVITGPGPGMAPEIRIFQTDSLLLAQLTALPSNYRGGVNVAVADLDGDGIDEIIAGSGPGTPAMVRVLKATGEVLNEWVAYNGFLGGLDVAAVSATDTENGYIITSALRGGGPEIRVYQQNGTYLESWFAYDRAFRGGVRVSAVRDQDGVIQIVTGPATGGGSQLILWSRSGTQLQNERMYERWWNGGYDVSVGLSGMVMSNSKDVRTAAVRYVDFENQD